MIARAQRFADASAAREEDFFTFCMINFIETRLYLNLQRLNNCLLFAEYPMKKRRKDVFIRPIADAGKTRNRVSPHDYWYLFKVVSFFLE